MYSNGGYLDPLDQSKFGKYDVDLIICSQVMHNNSSLVNQFTELRLDLKRAASLFILSVAGCTKPQITLSPCIFDSVIDTR